MAGLRTLKILFAKRFEEIKTDSVGTETTTSNHLTDRVHHLIDSKWTHHSIDLLPSSALVSGYTTTPLLRLVLPEWSNGFLNFCFARKNNFKKSVTKYSNGFKRRTSRERARGLEPVALRWRTKTEPLHHERLMSGSNL